jgi:Calx-beta domain/K319L-like, PKD domain
LSGITQSAAIPGDILVALYPFIFVEGTNSFPANVRSTIEATNTAAPSVQNTNVVGGSPPNGSVTLTTVITDPDGTPGTGDETATDASFSVSYDNLNWTAGASGLINYRQDPIATAPPAALNNSLLINAFPGGFLGWQIRCAPGTVTGPDPGVIELNQNPAPFDTTQIEPPRQISIDDAGAVTEGGAANFTVTLDQPSFESVTVDFATSDGSAVAPGDYTSSSGTLAFAPGETSKTVTVQTIDDTVIEGTETFDVNLSSPTGNAAILDGLGVGTIISGGPDFPPTANAGADQTVDQGAVVILDGTGSSDPDGEALTFNWTAPAGITLSDPTSATPFFTAPDVSTPTAFTFTLEVCDEANPTSLCDTDTVVIVVGHADADAAGEVIVSGPVKAGQTSKTYVFRVSSLGIAPITIDPTTEIDAAVLVNGTANGTVTSLTGTKTISPGSRTRFRLRWTGSTPLAVGDLVEFTACLNLAGDLDPTNDCDSATFQL